MPSKNLSSEELENKLKTSPVPVLVDFWAEWCHPCRMAAPELEKLASSLGKDAEICSLNVDEAADAARIHEIRSIPTFILFSEGRERTRLTGFRRCTELESAVRKIL